MRTIKMIVMALLIVLMLTSCFSDESITEITTEETTTEETTAEETTAEETTAEETTAEETTAEETTAEETTAEETTAEETTAEETTAEETTAEETTAEETTAKETTAEETTAEETTDYGGSDFICTWDEIVINALDFEGLASKFSSNSKSILLEQALKRIQISDGEDSLTSAIAKIFNNSLLYFDNYAPCEIYYTYYDYHDGGTYDEFRVVWHPKECKEKFHATCRVLNMTLVSRMSNFDVKMLTKGMKKKEINGIQCYYSEASVQYDSYCYIVNANTFLRINPDPNYVNEEDVYKLLCYGKELSEILEPIFVEE